MSPSRMFVFVSRLLNVLFIIALVQTRIVVAQSTGQSRFSPPPDDWREIAQEVANSADSQAGPDNQGFAGAVVELMGTGPQLSEFNDRSKLVELNKHIVESNSRNSWQESVNKEGNYRILLPGPGKCSTIDQPTPFGPSTLYECEYSMTSADKEFVTSIRVCSAHEPAKFLAKYTAQERIALMNKMFEKYHQSKLSDYDHTSQTTAGYILGRPTERIRSTARRGDEWTINHSAMVYVADIRYHIQVTQHGKGEGALLSDNDIERVFSSFQLHKEPQPNSASISSSDSPGKKPDNGTAPSGFIDMLADQSLSAFRGVVRDPSNELEIVQADSDKLMRQYWRLERGVLSYNGPNKGVNIRTRKEYRNFELMLDWKIEADGDSGIYLRGFPQVQIWDTHSARFKDFGNDYGSGGLWNNRVNSRFPMENADKPAGSWNHFHIKMVNSRVSVELNGRLVVDATTMENYWEAGRPIGTVGPIELQSYYGEISFRNLFVRELPTTADELIAQYADRADRPLETEIYRDPEQDEIVLRQHGDSRSSLNVQMEQLRQAFNSKRNSFPVDNRFNGPGWNEDARYAESQQRKRLDGYYQGLNNTVPGFQPLPSHINPNWYERNR